ncbi:hypothetical protein JL721_11598 [Aureococcus anophagefferens]|nr:hypothetical protein JL721_11598 [Aureococcus anophagefferens]
MRLPARSSRLRAATLLCVVASALRPSHVVTRPSRVVDRRDVAPLALAGLAAAALAPGAARRGDEAAQRFSGRGRRRRRRRLPVGDVDDHDGLRRRAASTAKPYVTSPATGVRVDLGTDAIAPGLKEAILADARVGTTRRVVVPPSLGYGATGFPREDGTAAGAKGSIVPPDATLYYEFKIRSITLSRGIGFGLNFF